MDSVVSRFRRLAVAFVLAFSSFVAMAQALPHGIFREGEAQHFQLYFKWGLIMAKAGKAEFRMQSDTLAGDSVWHYALRFQTTGLFERVFPMRDSLDSYFTKPDCLLPLLELFPCSKHHTVSNGPGRRWLTACRFRDWLLWAGAAAGLSSPCFWLVSRFLPCPWSTRPKTRL